MKLTRKQIDIIREHTPQELKGKQGYSFVTDFGYYTPSQANWSYLAGYINYNNNYILVVKRFGEIM
jgi:hypothetical protein